MQETKERIEQLLGVELQSIYSSRKDDNEDEELGHFEVFEFEPNPAPEISSYSDPPVIALYEDGRVQLFHDATPYPCAVHTEEERRVMSHQLVAVPIPAEQLSLQDYEDFIAELKSNYS